MILSENESKNLLTKVLNNSKADSVIASLTGDNMYNLRFARNSLTTDGFSDGLSLSISSNIGKKTGTVSTNKFDEESVKAAVAKSEEIARYSPDNKEFMPPLGEQTYTDANNYIPETENLKAENRSELLSYIINESVKKDVTGAGYLEDEVYFTSVMSSNGLFAYNKGTDSAFSATVRTKDGTGSSRFEKRYVNINDLRYKKLSDWVIERSMLSVNHEIKPAAIQLFWSLQRLRI
jgi:predicted Zn-dependent protease